MWNVLFAIASAIISFGAGSAGLVNDNVKLLPKTDVDTYDIQFCYDLHPETKITLKWPDNFRNVPDPRATLNPKEWRNVPATFNSDDTCKTFPMGGNTERSFILIRKNARIPSCKTDELAGPGPNNDKPRCPGADNERHRGICNVTGYTELRKIAKAEKDGQELEIFWNPFTHNVGCGYKKENNNCGVGDRSNVNLGDFIYTLNSRDAFPPDFNYPNCPVRWDSGATEGEACSHYFDVYMAEDLYNKCIISTTADNPDDQCYFFKQVIKNCNEQTTFIPAPEANITIPPIFINKPFISDNDNTVYQTDKIVPGNAQEKESYKAYVWGVVGGTIINPATTNLLKPQNVGNIAPPFDYCKDNFYKITSNTPTPIASPTPTSFPLPTCLEAIGSINFKDEDGKIHQFKVYSTRMTPETFTLIKIGDDSVSYKYSITEKDYPYNLRHDPSLQLRVMQMITQNKWTWATPVCKPAVYLYPEKPTDLNVKLDIAGELTVSSPSYNAVNGWNITAYPDGGIEQETNDYLTPITYPYLYYEAALKGITIPKEGFMIEKSNIKNQISKIMKEIGFNDRETFDFLAYWLPRLTDKPYYFVTLLSESLINEKEHLKFSQNPDTLIRARFIFEGLDKPISVPPLNIEKHERKGFVATDWGGAVVGKSCSDISVK